MSYKNYKHNPEWEKFRDQIKKRQEEEDMIRWHQEEETELDWALTSTQDIIELRNIVRTRAYFKVLVWAVPCILLSLILIIHGYMITKETCTTCGIALVPGVLFGMITFGIGLWKMSFDYEAKVKGVPGMTLGHLNTLVEARTVHGDQYATFDGSSVSPYPGSYFRYGG